jgi:hypothetical protein
VVSGGARHGSSGADRLRDVYESHGAGPGSARLAGDSVYRVTALSELLVAANKTGMSARAIARLAQERGHSLNHDTAARYLRGDHGTPDEATLVGFSEVLDVPLRRLRAAADLPAETTAPYVPPAEASRLTRRQRRAVDEIIRAMLEPVGRGADVRQLPSRESSTSTVTSAPSARRGGRRAARQGEPEPPTD